MKKAPGVGKVEIVQDVRMVDGKVLVSFGSRILAEQVRVWSICRLIWFICS